MSKPADNADLLKQLMDSSPDNIFFKDRDHRFIMINQANARWFGFRDPQEVIGKTDFDLFEEEFAQQAQSDEERIMETGEPMLGDEEQTLHNGEVVWGHVTKVPLRDGDGNIIGIIGIGRDITRLKRKELELAETNRKLNEAKLQIETDLQMAAKLQQTFLPQSYPAFISDNGVSLLDIQHYYKADVELGGDFCAIYRLSDTRAGLLICDVMGHGVRAALVTGIIRSFAEELAQKAETPGAYLSGLNEKLYPILRSENNFIFATACYLEIDVSTGELTGALAGHTLPYLIRATAGQASLFSIDKELLGPALAITEGYPYRNFCIALEPGDKVLTYTDGICEAVNPDGLEFGEQHFQQTLQAHCRFPIKELIEQTLDEVEHFTHKHQLGDDICLIGFSLNGLIETQSLPRS